MNLLEAVLNINPIKLVEMLSTQLKAGLKKYTIGGTCTPGTSPGKYLSLVQKWKGRPASAHWFLWKLGDMAGWQIG